MGVRAVSDACFAFSVPKETVYRCKKCRVVLGGSWNVFPHSTRSVPTWFSMLESSSKVAECRLGVFMEPMPNTMAKVCQVS